MESQKLQIKETLKIDNINNKLNTKNINKNIINKTFYQKNDNQQIKSNCQKKQEIIKQSENKTQKLEYKTKEQKLEEQLQKIKLIKIENTKSEVTLWHRPTNDQIKGIKKIMGINMIISCQSEKEKVNEIKQECIKNNIEHIWVNLGMANQKMLNDKQCQKYLIEQIKMINDKLKGNSFKVLIHCAAGIHRTGVVTYTLLRINGYSNENAMNEILQMRKDTYEGVGQWRIQLADQYLVPLIINI